MALDSIKINNIKIDSYSDYFVLNEKTYPVEPQRSANGVMEDLNAISTFIVPRLFLSFKYLNADKFRQLITIINNTNEYSIEYYDINDHNTKTRLFYLKPYSKANLFSRIENDEAVFKGVSNLSLEFVGTLREEV